MTKPRMKMVKPRGFFEKVDIWGLYLAAGLLLAGLLLAGFRHGFQTGDPPGYACRTELWPAGGPFLKPVRYCEPRPPPPSLPANSSEDALSAGKI